jgi:hypothetical protein
MRCGKLIGAAELAGMVLCFAGVMSVSAGRASAVDLAAPTYLEAMPLDDTTVHLSWLDNATGEDGFNIYRKLDDGSDTWHLVGTVLPNYTGWDDTSFILGEFYVYYVAAYSGAVDGPPSNEATVEARAPYINILTPADGEVLTAGQMYDVTWQTNVPGLDARIYLSTDGGVTWPPQHLLQYSWAPNPSPFPWKVGYKNTEPDSSTAPVWVKCVNSTQTNCKIFIRHYAMLGVQNWSVGTFTIVVPGSGGGGGCGELGGIWIGLVALIIVARVLMRRRVPVR